MSESMPASELITRYFDNVADTADLDALQRQLTTHPEVADAFVEAAWFDALLHTSLVHRIRANDLELSIAASLGPVLQQSRQVADQLLAAPAGEPEEFGLPPVPGLNALGGVLRHVTQIGVFPYLAFAAATFLLCFMGQLAWEWSLGGGRHVAKNTPAVNRSVPKVELTYVGRVTGMSSCEWVEGSSGTAYFDRVAIGRQFKLRTGLLEITYDNGAKVILQGPVAYEVTGNNRGRLSVGRVTGQVTTERARGFLIDTPTANVTDLGTEFGVEVSPLGETTSHVYRGTVRLQTTSTGSLAEAAACVLRENEAARVETDSARKPVIQTVRVEPATFVRSVPEGMPLGLFGTGVGVNVGMPDPHWQIVRLSGDPNFQPRAAVVVDWPVKVTKWLGNHSQRSQWISLPGGAAPNGVTCTFRTTFEVTGVHLETAGLLGRFIVDDHARTIRLNGHEIPVPEHGHDAVWERAFIPFSIAEGFVEGRNVLEIDVENSNQHDRTRANEMGLCVELVAVAEGKDQRNRKR